MLEFYAQAVSGGRRERQKAERRGRIEAAARAVFAERGYDVATTREIAERADVSIGTLFAYAPDKRTLLGMVFRDELHAMTERTLATVRPEAPLIEQLMHLFAPRYAFWGADPVLARHAVRETIALSYDGTTPPEAELGAGILRLVHAAQARAAIDAAVDAHLIVRVILDIYLSEHRGWLAQTQPVLADGIARLREALTLALRGLYAGSTA
jgi:AcrR family transcriptional regulator